MKLALKVDVDTYRGTLQGVPRLADLFRRNRARASFLFSLGPDHTGRAIRRALRPGFVKKVQRTSVVEHYGIKTLLYGTLLPGPDIGRRCADILRSTRDAGFETGIHCWDHVRWQDGVESASPAWTETEMRRAHERYAEVFGNSAICHSAAGWQMNAHALRLTQRFGYAWASDCRGTHPFMPVWQGEIVHCPQFPTTLPTLDEMIGVDGITADNVVGRLLARTAAPTGAHVFTLHAELEGLKFAPLLETLLAGWREQGYDLVAVGDLLADIDPHTLPRHEMVRGTVAGRSGTLMLQGDAFLSSWKEAA